MAGRRRGKLIGASFELCTKGHEANSLDDTCVDGAEVSTKGCRRGLSRKLRRKEENRVGKTDNKRPIDR